jgi:hypothetical protein
MVVGGGGVTEKADSSDNTWFVYIVRCDDCTLYTEITNDLIRRCDQHTMPGRLHVIPAVVCLSCWSTRKPKAIEVWRRNGKLQSRLFHVSRKSP